METDRAIATNPFTGEVITQQNFLSTTDINQRIKTSWTAFQTYRNTDPKTRSEWFCRLADILNKNIERLAKTITLEMGKPIRRSRKEVTKSIKLIRYYAQNITKFLKTEEISGTSAKKTYVLYQPLGPIYQMTSCNYPLFSIIRRAVPSLLTGNTVLNRPSSTTPQTAQLVEEIFREAGFANGEYLTLMISHESSEVVISNPLVRGVTYIGNVSRGHCVASWAGQHSKKIVMELGSNNPFIVLRDADLDLAVEQAVTSRLRSSGQSALSSHSFFIEESVYEDFKNRLVQRVKEIRIGDPLDESTQLGPLACRETVQQTYDQIKRSQQQGAKVLYGGEQPKESQMKKGFFVVPTVLEVQEGNVLLAEQTLAPVFPLIRFKSDQDIVRLVNSTPYGLSSSIFSTNLSRAQTIGVELEVGSVFFNTRPHRNASVPMGGVKSSGYGHEGGMCGVREFVHSKTCWIA
jgi:succinate-semialdehyde dehydrogenase/glutarate-semialdehyde dehydrogenase